ncbi:MAG: (Fe-S)-binding protein [Nitrospinae bacterium]|nr:(Fe-S)-binding protein [Nitrospinota bacterium]
MSIESHENRPKRVLFFATCLVDQFFPEVGEATVHLLESADIEVIFPEGLTCCGLPHFNNGFRAEARKTLETQLHLLEGDIPIIAPSGSCGWMLKCVLPTLFTDDPWEREKAAQIAERVIELSQFLCQIELSDFGSTLPGKTAYHDSCHLLRGLGENQTPRQCLDHVAESREELPNSDRCCGFGGSFCVKFPEVSCAMLEDKINSAEKIDATWLVAADAGCMLNIAGGLSRRNSKIKLLHLAQALAGPNNPGWPEEFRL